MKARLKYSMGIIITFAIFTMGLATYIKWMPYKVDNGKGNIVILGLMYLLIGLYIYILKTEEHLKVL